ncbi:hypothetical protein C8R47DRAFT_1329676 [Mycena vitilis]|nr:hypothetical protein C8R47DRAFT_1329676 [Mycena vitilis]
MSATSTGDTRCILWIHSASKFCNGMLEIGIIRDESALTACQCPVDSRATGSQHRTSPLLKPASIPSSSSEIFDVLVVIARTPFRLAQFVLMSSRSPAAPSRPPAAPVVRRSRNTGCSELRGTPLVLQRISCLCSTAGANKTSSTAVVHERMCIDSEAVAVEHDGVVYGNVDWEITPWLSTFAALCTRRVATGNWADEHGSHASGSTRVACIEAGQDRIRGALRPCVVQGLRVSLASMAEFSDNLHLTHISPLPSPSPTPTSTATLLACSSSSSGWSRPRCASPTSRTQADGIPTYETSKVSRAFCKSFTRRCRIMGYRGSVDFSVLATADSRSARCGSASVPGRRTARLGFAICHVITGLRRHWANTVILWPTIPLAPRIHLSSERPIRRRALTFSIGSPWSGRGSTIRGDHLSGPVRPSVPSKVGLVSFGTGTQ